MTIVELPRPSSLNIDEVPAAPRVTHDSLGATVTVSGEHDLATRLMLCDVLAFVFSPDDSDVFVEMTPSRYRVGRTCRIEDGQRDIQEFGLMRSGMG